MRVIGKPRGNMLLVGIGGSGRQSLTRLAAYMTGFKVFQIEVTRNYKKAEFRDGKDQKISLVIGALYFRDYCRSVKTHCSRTELLVNIRSQSMSGHTTVIG